jgi:hypothetical protein
MKYCFIEYTANEMIDGDWRWYLDTYKIDPANGARQWILGEKFEARVYEIPKKFRSYWMTHIIYAPGRAKRDGQPLPSAPDGYRWGILAALHEEFIKELGAEEFARCTDSGPIRCEDGTTAEGWRAVIFRNVITFEISEDDSADACLQRLNGEAIASSARFSLIIRGDLAWKLTAAQFPGCRVHWRGKD